MLTARQQVAVLIATLASACVAIAQEPPTRVLRPLLGKIVDHEGQGVIGAEVHLSFSPIGNPDLAATEHKVTTTDQRGRFRFQAQPCTKHLIWAIGAARVDGVRLATTLQWISPGRPFELVADQEHPECKLTISGIESWADYAPLHVQMAPGGIPVEGMTAVLDETGSCTLPPLPGGLTSVSIHDKDGQPLTTVSISKHERKITRAMHPLQELPMVVVDPEGKAIAGATIRQRVRANGLLSNDLVPSLPNRVWWRDIGKTDADGKLVAHVANRGKLFTSSHWQGLFFTATKEGRNTTHSGISEMPFFDGQQVKGEGLTALKFTLREAKPTILRLMQSPERGLANQAVTVKSGVRVKRFEKNGYSNESIVLQLTTDQDGLLRIPALTEQTGGFELLLGGVSVTGLIPEPLRRMSPYRAITLHEIKATPEKEQRIDLHKAAKVKLQLLGEHGGPVTDAELMLISRANRNNYTCNGWNTMASTDSAGRVALLVQPGRWSVFVRTKTGMAHVKLKLADGESQELNVSLKKMATMHGRVVDGDGKPIANVRLDCHSSTWHSGGNRDPILEAIAQNMNWNWISGTVTDKDGMFACAFLDLPGMGYEARVSHNRKKSPDFQIVPNDSPVTITIQ